jgi:hypothetical protein
MSISDCIVEKMGEKKDEEVERFIIEHYEREINNQVRENDKCMKKHSQVSMYWEAQEIMKGNETGGYR